MSDPRLLRARPARRRRGRGAQRLAAAELLARRGADVTLTDQRDTLAGGEATAGRRRAARARRRTIPRTLRAADLVVLSPGVPPDQPVIAAARAAGVPVIGELELASRWLRGRIVAITGTKGKSTTTTLTGRMLEAGGHRVLVGGNIGHALSAQVDASTDDTIHVVEASSFQLETTDTFHPWIAVLPELLSRSPRSARHRRRVRRRQGAHLRQPDARRLGGDERRRPRGDAARVGGGVAKAADLHDRFTCVRRAGARRRDRPADVGRRSAAAAAVVGPAARTAPHRRRARRVGGGVARGGRRGRDDAGRRGVPRARARARAGRRDRRRAVRERLEGHQRRGRAARDRELRRRWS